MRILALVPFAIILASGENVAAQPRQVAVSAAAISSNGKVIALADDANRIHVFDLKTAKRTHVLKPETQGASWRTAVAVSSDGRLVGYADAKANITICDLSEENAALSTFETASTRKVVDGHAVWIHSIAFHPESKSLLVAGSDGSLQCWDYTTKKLTRTISEGVKNPIRSGKTIVVIDGIEREGTWQDSYGWASSAMAVTHDFKLAATTNGADSIKLWDVKTGKEIRELRFASSSSSRVASLSFSTTGKKLAAVMGYQFGGTRSYHADYAAIWDVQDGKITHEIPAAEKDGSREMRWLFDAKFDVIGERLLMADSAGGNATWEISTGKKTRSFATGRWFFVEPNGESVIVVADGGLVFQSMKTGKEIWRQKLFE